MNDQEPEDFSSFSMLELFKVEVENNKTVLTDGLLALEDDPTNDEILESLMRAAHSIKGAARIVQLDAAVEVAHRMEDAFERVRSDSGPLVESIVSGKLSETGISSAFHGQTSFRGLLTDVMLAGVDLLWKIASAPEAEIDSWIAEHRPEIDRYLADVAVVQKFHADSGEGEQPTANVPSDFSDMSMLDLFRVGVDNQKSVLNDKLLALESDPGDPDTLEALMRAAHSIKGAARIVNLDVAVHVAHAMEDAFESIRQAPEKVAAVSLPKLSECEGLDSKYHSSAAFLNLLVDVMLDGVDLLAQIANTPESNVGGWLADRADAIDDYLQQIRILLQIFAGEMPASGFAPVPAAPNTSPPPVESKRAAPVSGSSLQPVARKADTFLRVTADNLNRILALSGESQIETSRLRPFTEGLQRFKRELAELNLSVDNLRDTLATQHLNDEARAKLAKVRDDVGEVRRDLNRRLGELESISRRHHNVSDRLYEAAIACRMRPFADGIQGFPRMVRDISRQLGKQVKLEVLGEDTQVDRDILERLEAQITQLLRNAIDHGLESPEERSAAGKNPVGQLTLEARHSSGKLLVSVADDGRGINYDALRENVVRKKLTTADTAARLSESELAEFLFLPGFSQKEQVTDISGRGVGLDIVYNMVKSVRGTVRIQSEPGMGTRFDLQLPLTLSVLRSLLVEVNGQPYAFPLAETQRAVKVDSQNVSESDFLPTTWIDEHEIELVPVARLFEQPVTKPNGRYHVVLVGERDQHYGLVVDRFLGERELVVQPLDPRLGKIQDISAGALMDDGNPVLIVDVQDIIRGADRICRGETAFISREDLEKGNRPPQILVADDSLTVREMERQLLVHAGFEVTVALDGIDAWNAIRAIPDPFDLIVTDMDMPRMSGIELTELVRADTGIGDTPIIMISYKDRAEDQQRAISAGVDLYLTKGSFEDEAFVTEVKNRIRERA